MNDIVQRYAASAARMGWITESRYRELTGQGIQAARAEINAAPAWPDALEQRLTDFLDTLSADTPRHIIESNLVAFRLHPVVIRDVGEGWWEVLIFEVGMGMTPRARLHFPAARPIQAVLSHWHVDTPACAWENPALTAFK